VTSIAVPWQPGGRRRFEVALGNKRDKLDLESIVAFDDELVAFGSGSLPVREQRVRITGADEAILEPMPALYAELRAATGTSINIEGVARIGDELWFCHRG